jgi:hypothetical protein
LANDAKVTMTAVAAVYPSNSVLEIVGVEDKQFLAAEMRLEHL